MFAEFLAVGGEESRGVRCGRGGGARLTRLLKRVWGLACFASLSALSLQQVISSICSFATTWTASHRVY